MKKNFKKYVVHSKLVDLGENFNPCTDLDYSVFENWEYDERFPSFFTHDLIVPHLKKHGAFFNLGYLNVARVEKNLLTEKPKEIMEKHKVKPNKLQDFFDFHTKPYIDMIRIFEPYQRKGIAEQLIMWTAKYYSDKDLIFCFSNAQLDEMAELREKMIAKYTNIKRIKGDGKDRFAILFEKEKD